jgi:hypothetical protein
MPAVGNPGQRIAFEGKVRHYFYLGEIGNKAAPTVGELTDPTTLDASRYVPKDGMSGDPTFQRIPSTDITEVFDAEQMGSWGEQIEFQMYVQDPDDDAFDFFDTNQYATMTHVMLFNADGDSPSDGDRCRVRTIETSVPVPLPHAPNTKQRFRLACASLSAPEFNATVVAGS